MTTAKYEDFFLGGGGWRGGGGGGVDRGTIFLNGERESECNLEF